MDSRRQRIRRKLIFIFFLMLPITLNYYSPALMTQGTAERVATFSLVLWTTVFLSSFVLGRSFCGYGCPFNGLQMAWETVRDKPLRRVRYIRWIKYSIWGLWAGAVVAFAVSASGWQRFDPLYNTEFVVSVDSPQNLIVYYALVLATLLPLALGRHAFCHYFCPFGVWGIVGTKVQHALRLPGLRLRADAGACTSCGTCDTTCPMSLPVSSMVARQDMCDTECILCGSCVDGCVNGGIDYSWRRD